MPGVLDALIGRAAGLPTPQDLTAPSRLAVLAEAVIARLRTYLPPSVHVDRFPDSAPQYDMQGREAAVLVLITGGQFAAPQDVRSAGLFETVSIVCPVLVRSLSGALGHEALIEDVRLALQGTSLAGGSALRPTGWHFADRDEEIFRFDFDFETRLPAVAGADHPLMRRQP